MFFTRDICTCDFIYHKEKTDRREFNCKNVNKSEFVNIRKKCQSNLSLNDKEKNLVYTYVFFFDFVNVIWGSNRSNVVEIV